MRVSDHPSKAEVSRPRGNGPDWLVVFPIWSVLPATMVTFDRMVLGRNNAPVRRYA